MTAAILIVSDDPALLATRAALLKSWEVSTVTSEHAMEAIRSSTYDLIIFCQTIPDELARALTDRARALNPAVKTMAAHLPGQERNVNAELYEIQVRNPARLLSVVARLLQPSSLHSQTNR